MSAFTPPPRPAIRALNRQHSSLGSPRDRPPQPDAHALSRAGRRGQQRRGVKRLHAATLLKSTEFEKNALVVHVAPPGKFRAAASAARSAGAATTPAFETGATSTSPGSKPSCAYRIRRVSCKRFCVSTKDHRNSEYALRSAVVYAVHHHALGDDKMLIHGKRAGKRPDIALIAADGGLNLVELKLTVRTETDALEMLSQIAGYAVAYDNAAWQRCIWYCHARVESLCGLSFRGGEGKRFEQRDGAMFHRVEEFNRKQVLKYREASTNPEAAYAAFAEDFELRFGQPLEAGPEATFKVAGATLVAESWGERVTETISEAVQGGLDSGRLDPAALQVLARLNVDTRCASPRTWLPPALRNG